MPSAELQRHWSIFISSFMLLCRIHGASLDLVLGAGRMGAQASTLWLQAQGEVCDSFLQLYKWEKSYILENQSAGCCEGGVALWWSHFSQEGRADFLQCWARSYITSCTGGCHRAVFVLLAPSACRTPGNSWRKWDTCGLGYSKDEISVGCRGWETTTLN